MKTKVEAKPTQLAALNPDVRLPEKSDQPASKGYIMYANLPTNWTPLPLPDGISSASTPHTDNIRAEIEQAAKLFDVDIQMMKAFAKIESGYNPKAKTGSYKCLFQLSNQEFAKYWQGNIYDIRDCSVAAARKFATEAAQLRRTSVVGLRRQNSTASTSKAMKAVRFITTRRSSWHGKTCT